MIMNQYYSHFIFQVFFYICFLSFPFAMPKKSKNDNKNKGRKTSISQSLKSKLVRLKHNKQSLKSIAIFLISFIVIKWIITPVPKPYFDLKWSENNKNLLKLTIQTGPDQHKYRVVTTNPARVLPDTFLRSKILILSGGESTSLEHLVQAGWMHEFSKRGFSVTLLDIPELSVEEYENFTPELIRNEKFMNIDSGVYNLIMFDTAIPKIIPFIVSSPTFFASLTFIGFADDVMDQVFSTVSNLKKLKHNDRVNSPILLIPKTVNYPNGEDALDQFLHKPLIKCNQKNCNTFKIDLNAFNNNATDVRNAMIDSVDLFFSQKTIPKARNPIGGTTIINKDDFVTSHFLQGNGTGKMDASEFRKEIENQIKENKEKSAEGQTSEKSAAQLARAKKMQEMHERWLGRIERDFKMKKNEEDSDNPSSSLSAKNFG